MIIERDLDRHQRPHLVGFPPPPPRERPLSPPATASPASFFGFRNRTQQMSILIASIVKESLANRVAI
jgi:hypothetical protein